MTTLLLSHEECLSHEVPADNPERADRLRALQNVFLDPEFDNLVREDAPLGSEELALLVHKKEYVKKIRDLVPAKGIVPLAYDTGLAPHSWQASMRGVGAGVAAVDAVISKRVKNAFCAIRPPGHHAEKEQAMGFCFFNNVAIAARFAQKEHGLGRVAIMDFDVHHGNGTQDIFWDDESVLFCSTHEMPLYPGTGDASETGAYNNIVNAPLRAGDGSSAFRQVIEKKIAPAIDAFEPELILISAGFDAHVRDPLANLSLEAEDFTWVTKVLLQLADTHAKGRLVSILEGGYDLTGLAESAAAHVTQLMTPSN